MPDPRRTVENHIRNYSGIPSELADQLLKDEAGCIALLSHPNVEVRYAALQCCHAIWKGSLSKDVVERIIVPVLAGESHNGLLSLCLTIVGETFDGTGRRDLIAAMLRIANDTSKSNFIRNLGYKNAHIVTFGKEGFRNLTDDGPSYETEVIGQERLLKFDEKYMRAFSPEVAQAAEIYTQPFAINYRFLGIAVFQCIAIKIALSWTGYLDPSETLTNKLLGMVATLVTGSLSGVGVMVLAAAILRKRIDLLTPGHWIAVWSLAYLLSEIVAAPWQSNYGIFFEKHPAWGVSMHGLVTQTARNLLGCVLFITIGLRNTESKAWNAFAWLTASTHLLGIFGTYLDRTLYGSGKEDLFFVYLGERILAGLCNFSMLILFFIALLADLKTGVQRDRLHWFCIGVNFSGVVIFLALAAIISLLKTYLDGRI